jgi:hypothetical protein
MWWLFLDIDRKDILKTIGGVLALIILIGIFGYFVVNAEGKRQTQDSPPPVENYVSYGDGIYSKYVDRHMYIILYNGGLTHSYSCTNQIHFQK